MLVLCRRLLCLPLARTVTTETDSDGKEKIFGHGAKRGRTNRKGTVSRFWGRKKVTRQYRYERKITFSKVRLLSISVSTRPTGAVT